MHEMKDIVVITTHQGIVMMIYSSLCIDAFLNSLSRKFVLYRSGKET